jgi:N-acetyl-anhydromuramyl-L-alanine amidase AmpD
VGKNGEIHQYVAESDTAFHVGVVDHPAWPLLKAGINPNLYTIGIEHEGRDGDALTPAQLHASAALIAAIAKRWKIPLDAQHIIRHHDIRRGKPCPGAGFDVAALITAAKGVSL